VLAAVAVCLLAAGAGYLLGRPEDKAPAAAPQPAALSSSVTAAGLALRYPADWDPRQGSPQIPGLALEDALTVGPRSGDRSGIVVGRAQSDHPSLLPAALRKRLARAPAADDRVRLGSLQAIRYRDLELAGFGGRRLTLYVVPTTSGVATVGCFSNAPAAAVCDRVAATARLVSGRAYALGPEAGYAAGVGGALATLDRARRSGRTRLAAAKRPTRQAAAAAALATAHRKAARTIARFEVTPAAASATASLAASLEATARAYDRLATAARRNDGGAYAAAAKAVGRGESAVERSLAGLERLGYRVK